jgi:hypothetical protein
MVAVFALAGVVLGEGVAGANPPRPHVPSHGDQGGSGDHTDHGNGTYVCSGTVANQGSLAGNYYGSVIVKGVCAAHGRVTIKGSLTITPDSGLVANDPTEPDPSDPFGPPICLDHVQVNVFGGIRVLSNGILFLGDSLRGTGCQDSNGVVYGGLQGLGSNSVVVHGTKINDGFSLQGGGGGNSYVYIPPPSDYPPPGWNCADITVGGVDIGTPPFSDVEDSQINGGATIDGLHTCWMGFINNQVHGSVNISHNKLGDPDAIEIGLNLIHGPLGCWGNYLDPHSHIAPNDGSGGVPTNSFDGSPSNPNTVIGPELGQCAGL